MVACFRYTQITIHTFYLPPLKLEFNSQKQQDWLINEENEVCFHSSPSLRNLLCFNTCSLFTNVFRVGLTTNDLYRIM